jgi:hypothetical protein
MVKVTVCVCYNNRAGGGSEMLTQVLEFAIPPAVHDMIEILPEQDGGDISAWHSPVARRYIHRTEDVPLEVHVEMPRRELSADDEAQLRAGGYS